MLPLASENVLVCLRYGIGDVIMELPALAALRRALPDATITAIATPPADELLAGDPRVDRVVRTSRWGLRHRWDTADAVTRAEVARWVREQRFDLVLDAAHATTAVGQAIWSLGIRSLESSQRIESDAIRRGESGVEAVRRGVAAGWGLDVPALAPEIRPRPADHRFAAERLRGIRATGDRPFAVSPVASHSLKRWPSERFAAVADHLVGRGAEPVLVIEGPQAEQGRAVVAGMRHAEAAVRIGPEHLLRTAALLQRCRGLVCNDTGLMHLAAAAGVPTIGVFGATRKQVFLPPGPDTIGVEPAGVDCRYRRTGTLHPPECWRAGRCLIAEEGCIRRSRLEDVLEAVDELLRRAPAASLPTTWHGAHRARHAGAAGP